MRLAAISALAASLAGVATAAEQTPVSGNAERGRAIYMQELCYTCHGTVGQGGERGAGPRIAPQPWPYPAFAQQVRKPRLVMVPYSEKVLPEQDLRDIHAYLSTIPPAPPASNIPLLSGF